MEKENFKPNSSIPLQFELAGRSYKGEALITKSNLKNERYSELDITLNGQHFGILYRGSNDKWTLPGETNDALVAKITGQVELWIA